ncbi:MAG: hypothetical protein AAB588_00570 [Patescibacteria group bacterium]
MQCFNRKFLGETRLMYVNGGERPSAAPKSHADIADTTGDDQATRASKVLAGAMNTCDGFTCKVEVAEKPWQEQATKILDKIGQDKFAALAFNTFLQEYARGFGGSVDFTDDVTSNFYSALQLSGVPDSEVGFNTAWNDILSIAKEGVRESSTKAPYEKLKSIVDSVRNTGGNAVG